MKNFLAAAIVAMASASAADATVFAGSTTIGKGGATFFIKTDGTVGSLGTANITAWDFTLTDGSITKSLNNANSAYGDALHGFTATSNALLFDFSKTGGLFFANSNAIYCLTSTDVSCDGVVGEQINLVRGTTTDRYVVARSGTQTIATAVPEPATWAMMLVGFGVMGGVLRRRHRITVRYA